MIAHLFSPVENTAIVVMVILLSKVDAFANSLSCHLDQQGEIL
jgi:hypothetical protein